MNILQTKKSYLLVFTFISCLAAKVPVTQSTINELPPDVFRSSTTVEHTVWDGNQISTWHGNHGDVVSFHITGNSGLEWPKGSGKLAVFQSGIWLASGRSKAPGGDWQPEIRTAAAEYAVEFIPGTIDGLDGHIYEIHRAEVDAFLENDFTTFSTMSAELPITEGDARTTSIVSFPTQDFENWPADLGAPWVDANGDGIYNITDGDYPDILGDQFHWYVMNDGDAATHTPLWGTTPMDVEVQASLFGFNQSGALGDILFIRWVIENKGDDELDSVYVSMWHDDDVGDATDDLVGCDVDLSLGYTYNDTDGDNSYGVEVPAAGADFFQGPIVPSVGDTASILTWDSENSYHLQTIPDYKQLPLTSFVKYINGSQDFKDPETSEEAYRYMNGLIGISGEPYTDPITGNPSVFVHDGDPVAGTGWLDDDPGDRRYLMTSGPFSFAPGDVQEVVGCIIIAGGSDWAKSITKLKYFDKFAQAAFDANFDVCSPPIPTVSVAQLDEKIILSFEEGSENVENFICAEYTFEGYNIYQGESPNGPWERITTFDLVNDIKTIMDLELDETTGEILELQSQFGTDSGIEHHIELTEDEINSGHLINSRKYYYAVTAYAYDPDAAQRVIESPTNAITAIPMEPGLGSDIEATYHDLLEVNHTSGIAGLEVYAQVIDPYQLTGDDYSLYFTTDTITGDNFWNLINTTDNDSLFLSQTTFPASSYTITDGFILTFDNATFDAPTNSSNTTQTVFGDTSSETNITYSITDGTWTAFMAGYGLTAGTTEKEVLQKDIKFVFTEEPQKGFYWNGINNDPFDLGDMPFEIWTVEDSVRINAAIWILTGGEDMVHYDDFTVDSNGDTINFISFHNHKIVPIYTPYDTTATFKAWNDGSENLGWVMQFNKDESQFVAGDEFVVEFNNPVFPGVDEFTFTATGEIAASSSTIQSQLDAINVFPNPYFGKNVEETNPLDRFVSFTHFGIGKQIIRIYNLAGDLIKKIEQTNDSENDAGNIIRWDLRNNAGVPVASGMYLAYIETPFGNKILKLAIMQPEERIDVY